MTTPQKMLAAPDDHRILPCSEMVRRAIDEGVRANAKAEAMKAQAVCKIPSLAVAPNFILVALYKFI